MAASTVASVHELAAELLATSETALATTVGGPPAASFLSPGLPALDRQCDTLAVWSDGASIEGEQGGPTGAVKFVWVNVIGLSVLIGRCITVAEDVNGRYRVPTPSQLTADAEKVQEDMWALWNGVTTAILDGTLFEGWPCRDIRFASLIPLDPQGGFGGWTLSLAVVLDGYEVI